MDGQTGLLTDELFSRYCSVVYQECGIKLTAEKRALLSARLSKRLRSLGVSPVQYYDMIARDPDEMGRFIDAISTNHTFFFREPRPFRFIPGNHPDIWCAAAASGEEPYSVAAHCLQGGISPAILATDISETCLAKARLGIYPERCIQTIPSAVLKACFQKGRNRWQGFVRVRPELKERIRFEKFNLLKDVLPERTFDVIFCRNVMIYFDAPTKERVVARLTSVLKPQGYFIIGGSESLNGLRHDLKYIEPSVYRKSSLSKAASGG